MVLFDLLRLAFHFFKLTILRRGPFRSGRGGHRTKGHGQGIGQFLNSGTVGFWDIIGYQGQTHRSFLFRVWMVWFLRIPNG